jgi:hypothetical protein
MSKIEGTNKFVIYMYNGRNKRQRELATPEHFVSRQPGIIFPVDENGKQSKTGYKFSNYGQMVSYINKILIVSIRNNLRGQGTWRKNGR